MEKRRKKIGKEVKERLSATYFWFYNLQIPHLDAASSEIRYLELDTNRSLPFSPLRTTHTSPETPGHATPMLIIPFDRRQTQFSPHEELFATAKLLDFPDDG